MTFERYNFQFILSIFIILILSSCSKDVDYTPPEGKTEISITHFSYDKLVVDGKTYITDVIILPDGKITGWGFDRDTHIITSSDFQDLITKNVKTVIIGSGYHGDGFFDDNAKALVKKLESNGISIHFLPTSKAVNLYNASSKQGLLTFLHIRN